MARGQVRYRVGMGTGVATAPVMKASKPMDSKEILVVDDERAIGELLVFLLTEHGYHAEHAGNGLAALRRLAQTSFDLVLTDFTMPIMNGCDLLEAMSANKRLATMPVLVVSALPLEFLRAACPRAAAFLAKPFTSEDLLDSVGHIVGPPVVMAGLEAHAVGAGNMR
jgi:CheY-like chemotaxis protein